MSENGPHRRLIVWEKAMNLVPDIYRLTREFPREERFGLSDQMQRAAVSVTANIAEGQARSQPKEFAQFLRIARGSLAELETHLTLCQRVGLIAKTDLQPLMALADEVGKMIRGLQKAISNNH